MPPVYEASMQLLEKYGRKRISFSEWRSHTKASAGESFLSLGISVEEAQIDADFATLYREIVVREVNPIRPVMYSDVPFVLRTLADKKLPVAIISSHPRDCLEQELKEYSIRHFFDEISGDPFPKTARLQRMCERRNLSPSDVFFVEDTSYGLQSGHAAGVQCFGVTTGYRTRERLLAAGCAIAVLDSLRELLEYVDSEI